MLNEQGLRSVFERPYDRTDWYNLLRQNFYVENLKERPTDITGRIRSNDYNAKAYELGNFETPDGQLIGLYEVEVPQKAQLHRNRRALRDLLADVYRNDVEGALVVFIQDKKWRFTYVSEIAVRDPATEKRTLKSTDPKRYTYLFGEGEKAKTAAVQFAKLKLAGENKKKGITLEALKEAFNVEKMSKAFFNEYRKHYGAFTAYLSGEDENSKGVGKASSFLRTTFNGDKKQARDFLKKMLGRIVFLYFLEKKGWLGVPLDKNWGDGDENFLSNLFTASEDKGAFYSNVLTTLFFGALNTQRKDDVFKLATGKKVKIPFLNGGLFEEDGDDTQLLVFPQKLFAGLFEFFDRYNFTVYEDSPDEHTVAVDPEMLGHIFENLLEDNKDKGAFYTPKEIVHYMCQESLIEYLHTKLANPVTSSSKKYGIESLRTSLEKFIKRHEAGEIIDYDEPILKALKEVKVCDPAIGSGAFPMGILMEIFHAVETLFYVNPDTVNAVWKLGGNNQVFNAAAVKESIIHNSIYGVDIEKGAVDIARLRFWLSLIVDESQPKPLPNLDYKIMVGNSLLNKFEDEVIDIEWNYTTSHGTANTKTLIGIQVSKLHTLQAWQTNYFNVKGNKQKSQLDIRNIKIDILVNQLTLSKLTFQLKNPKLGGFAPTPKEIQKNLENELVLAGYDKTIKKLEAIKKDKNAVLEFFDWKLDFPQVMNDKVTKGETGFDIVIANPPYIDSETMVKSGQEIDRIHLTKKLRFAKGNWDIYIAFFDYGEVLTKKGGNLIFITPDKWISKPFGYHLRAGLLSSFLSVAEAGRKVFENAKVDSIITHLGKYASSDLIIYQYNGNLFYKTALVSKEKIKDPFALDWLFSPHTPLINKIESASSTLLEYGLCESACATSDAYKLKEYVQDNPKREFDGEKYFKVVNTGTIGRYKCRWKESVMTYLGDKYQSPLVKKKDFLSAFTKSYSLKAIKSKLIVKGLTLLDCCLDKDGESIPGKTTLIITHPEDNIDVLKAVCLLINSKLPLFYLKEKYRGASYNQGINFSKEMINNLPVPDFSSSEITMLKKTFDVLVKKLNNKDFVQQTELFINIFFYRKYNLSYDQAGIVEGREKWITENKYETFSILEIEAINRTPFS